jgi:hypothetical protein
VLLAAAAVLVTTAVIVVVLVTQDDSGTGSPLVPTMQPAETTATATTREQFKVVFDDRPELVESVRVGDVPASVRLRPGPGIRPETLVDQLRTEFPADQEVRIQLC